MNAVISFFGIVWPVSFYAVAREVTLYFSDL